MPVFGPTNGEVGATAPAKVNFTLDILDKRHDGYHEIRSIMQTITLQDTLFMRRGKGEFGIRLTVVGDFAEGVPVDNDNLVIRAARAFMAEVGIDETTERIEIDLGKVIPSQAGLGGGSSDAATALILANRLFERDLSMETMTRLARQLGSDVPFFLTAGTCRVEGLGEIVTPLDTKLGKGSRVKHILICKPYANVPTALAYRELDKARETSSAPKADSTSTWESTYAKTGEVMLSNDFEPIILSQFPEIARAYEAMAEAGKEFGASRPLLAGSGAALFCLLDDDHKLRQMACKVASREIGWLRGASTCTGGFAIA